MAAIEVIQDSYRTVHALTLDIYHEKASYPDDYYENATVTFPVPHLAGQTVTIEYSDSHGQDVLAQVMRDISAYLEDPQTWTEELIKKGVGPALELRQLEHELSEDQREHEKYMKYAAQKMRQIEMVERRIAEHKEKHQL